MMWGRRTMMRSAAVVHHDNLKSKNRIHIHWMLLLFVVITWREMQSFVLHHGQKSHSRDYSREIYRLKTMESLLGENKMGLTTYDSCKSEYSSCAWRNVSEGLDGHSRGFNLSDPTTLTFAAMVERMLVPFSKIPGQISGMGSRGMIGARMLHRMGEKWEFLRCAGHIRIVNGTVYFRYGGFIHSQLRLTRFHQSIKMLQDAVLEYSLQHIAVEFFLNTCDQPFSFLSAIAPPYAGYPMFSMQGAPGTTDIIVPDPMDVSNEYLTQTYPVEGTEAAGAAAARVPWESKLPKAVFRGASTNFDLFDYNWRASPRFRLHKLSDAHSELLDARLNRFERHRPETVKHMHEDGIFPSHDLTPAAMDAYKYEVVADGGVGTRRACRVLLSDRVMVKQSSAFYQFFQPLLTPGVHFIPTQHHFQDLPATIAWAREHDREMWQIAVNAKHVARNVCTWKGRTLYWAIVLAKYHSKAMENPDDVKVPAQLCRGRRPQALTKPYKTFEDVAPVCGNAEAFEVQPPCTYYCTGGPVSKTKWQWLSSNQLSSVDNVGPRRKDLQG